MAVVASVPHQRFSSSRSRRDSVLSSGRGGSGNIRRLGTAQDSQPTFDVDIISIRGREAPSNSDKFVSSGRGGSGNMRPPSPDRETHPLTAAILSQHVATQTLYEMHIRKKHAESKITRSSGRGGSGNISDQRRARSNGPPSRKSILARSRVKATRDDTSTDADAECQDRNESHMGIHRRARDSTLTSSSGADSLLTGSSQRSVAGSSSSGVADQDPCSSSPPSPTTDRSKKKRSFLARWKKPPNSSQPSSPTEIINTVLTEGEVAEPDCQHSCDRLSLQYDSYKEFPPSHTSPRTSSVVTSTSSSHSNRYSVQSALSLPNILECGEYVSFLEF
ncbi:hypothetical protein BDN67DRAFT_973228 [Paxillus ammoniavirescens]|nr:hypothetical protein BDN67DRAFT_973228 [Paxillus ammoniavirescens]